MAPDETPTADADEHLIYSGEARPVFTAEQEARIREIIRDASVANEIRNVVHVEIASASKRARRRLG